MYYTILAFTLFFNGILEFIKNHIILIIKYILLFLLIFHTAYGMKMVSKNWVFELKRVKDILLCGSVLYLIEKDLHIYKLYLINIFSSFLTIIIILLILYIIIKLRRWRFFLDLENYEIISIIFITSFLEGLSVITNEYHLGSLINITILILNIYIINLMFKWVKSII